MEYLDRVSRNKSKKVNKPTEKSNLGEEKKDATAAAARASPASYAGNYAGVEESGGDAGGRCWSRVADAGRRRWPLDDRSAPEPGGGRYKKALAVRAGRRWRRAAAAARRRRRPLQGGGSGAGGELWQRHAARRAAAALGDGEGGRWRRWRSAAPAAAILAAAAPEDPPALEQDGALVLKNLLFDLFY